jgi:hypothetical protein
MSGMSGNHRGDFREPVLWITSRLLTIQAPMATSPFLAIDVVKLPRSQFSGQIAEEGRQARYWV